jgi:DNA-binding NarL/FixJ family response regulator
MIIKILLVDNNKLFRELLTDKLSRTDDFEVLAELDESHDIVELVKSNKPDIVLMEAAFENISGIDLARSIQHGDSETKVVVLTDSDEHSQIRDMLDGNIWGYLLKNSTFDQLVMDLKHIYSGKKLLSADIQSFLIADFVNRNEKKEARLTTRETEILKLMAEGKSIREVSEQLYISIKTTGTHKQKIFDKLHFQNMTSLIRYAMNNGIIS